MRNLSKALDTDRSTLEYKKQHRNRLFHTCFLHSLLDAFIVTHRISIYLLWAMCDAHKWVSSVDWIIVHVLCATIVTWNDARHHKMSARTAFCMLIQSNAVFFRCLFWHFLNARFSEVIFQMLLLLLLSPRCARECNTKSSWELRERVEHSNENVFPLP